MRVLLANDGSAGAEEALALVGNLHLPEGTAITLVRVVPSGSTLFGVGTATNDRPTIERQVIGELESALDSAAQRLAMSGRTVEQRVLRGRPADALALQPSSVASYGALRQTVVRDQGCRHPGQGCRKGSPSSRA